jgi:RNA polymerase sigma factor (sigma-70 family)
MPKQRNLTKTNFDELLLWLNPDRDCAAAKYEEIYRSLIKIFAWRGCRNPEELADETVDRVAEKVHKVRPNYVGNPAIYFHGVANRIVLEEQRKVTLSSALDDEDEIASAVPDALDNYTEQEYDCLDECVGQLSPEDKEMMHFYYLKQGQAKIDDRRAMAEKLGISTATLRVRMYRIREKLSGCIERCIQNSSSDETKRGNSHYQGEKGRLR